MKITITEIQSILRKEDIEGYIEIHGAPENEYDPEAAAFHAALGELAPHEMTLEKTSTILTDIWSRMFDLSPDDLQKRFAAIDAVAKAVLESNAG